MNEFQSETNRRIILKIIDEVIREKYQITLSDDFTRVLNDIMNVTLSKFGHKTHNITDHEHLKILNQNTIIEANQYISKNIDYFPKIKNNRVQIINDNRQVSDGSIIPYNPNIIPNQGQSLNNQNQLIQTQQNQNLFKNTEDLYNQMQYNPAIPPAQSNGYNPQTTQFQPNNQFQPTQSSNQFQPGGQDSKLDPTALDNVLEQRRKEFPAMNYQQAGGNNNQSNGGGGSNVNLMSIILQTPIANQNPNLVPSIMTEIQNMPHLVEMMSKNPQGFQQQILAPGFLDMLVTTIRNRAGNKDTKPLFYNEPTSTPIVPETTSDDPNSEYLKRMNAYKNGDLSINTTTHQGQNLMTKYIPPTEQLVNNSLPDLDQIHLINYSLSLDFRDDLENTAKNRYLLKFHKYGNVSKIKLNSCLISENDYLAKEPYIYMKIEEVGGRCYTSNHDCVFGKLILSENRNGYLYYKPDENSCIQMFSQPRTLDKLTISFVNYHGKSLNLQEIIINKSLKLKKLDKLKFISEYKHKLIVGEKIHIHIYRKATGIDEYTVEVESIVDDNTFMVDNVFEVLTENIKVLRNNVNCSLSFQLSEINWNLLTNKNPQNAQLITLSQLVNSKKTQNLDTTINHELTNTIKTQLTQNQIQGQIPQTHIQGQLPQSPQIIVPYGQTRFN